jgi:crossover junction endodeoxyribonuclease RuvC
MGNRLAKIYNSVMTIIQEFQPIAIAIEQVFVNINPQTSQKLIMARSAALIAITNSEYNAHEYTPNEIKKTITGMGHSSKAQMYTMVKKICNCHLVKDGKTLTSDSIDALAVAITNAFSSH